MIPHRLLLTITTLALCACAQVQSHVTRFHENPALAGKRFVMITTQEQEQSLEYKAYAEKVGQWLQRYGMSPAPGGRADYGVHLDFSVDDGREVISSSPVYGQVGGGLGHSGKKRKKGAAGHAPIYGVIGTELHSDTIYTKKLSLRITDQARRRPVFEGSVISDGNDPSFAPVADCLMASLFQNFPGLNGQTETVILESDKCRPY